jgi:hypothetical protein
MAGNTITSANAVYLLSISGVFTIPVQLQGWAVDEAFDTEAVDAAVTQVGVDGTGVAGWVPREVPQTLTLLPSSPSNDVFDSWVQAQDAIQDIIYASGSIRIPSLGKVYSMVQGVLMSYPIVSDAKKVFQPRVFKLNWLPQPGIPAITVSPI